MVFCICPCVTVLEVEKYLHVEVFCSFSYGGSFFNVVKAGDMDTSDKCSGDDG